jgi:hypothetical protein
VWGVDSGALEAVLQFFYTGECVLTFQNMVAILDAAQRLEVRSLSHAADGYIGNMTFPNTVTTILRQAIHYKIDDLAAQCMKYITHRYVVRS